ncbi:MAG TPA: fatty acid desaturase [Phycisphaerales bacterium]|nr:fatty acid desaturase [Phycisphaerales bacterium]HRQ76728.1 fatty acid desaturase [Phycisphaerales bacterium]
MPEPQLPLSAPPQAVPFRTFDRLPTPDRVEWDRVMFSAALVIGIMHVLALLAALPWLFSWSALILCMVGVHVFGQAINIGYHRLLTHRSFTTPRWFEHFIVLIALCCMENTPGRWVATHRYHHNHSDEQEDPHTPLVGFFWAHVGWLLVHNGSTNSIAVYQKYARDILNDPFYMRLEKQRSLALVVYLVHTLLFAAAGALIGWLTAGTGIEALRMALSFVVWGVLVRTVLVWHITWSVNSLTHLFGYQNHTTDDNSRNNWLVAILTVGEGWHNNHHHDPAAASVQHRWWEIDISYYEIKLLEMVGLAKRVIKPRHIRHAARAANSTGGV